MLVLEDDFLPAAPLALPERKRDPIFQADAPEYERARRFQAETLILELAWSSHSLPLSNVRRAQIPSTVLLDRERCKHSGAIRAGIDTDSVWTFVNAFENGMPVDDHKSVVLPVR